jgi:hypothetical protein
LWIGENESPQLQVGENDTVSVTIVDSLSGLSKEASSFAFLQTSFGAQIRVQITVGSRRYEVEFAAAAVLLLVVEGGGNSLVNGSDDVRISQSIVGC